MIRLIYSRKKGTLEIIPYDEPPQMYPANNNTARDSKGAWPLGSFEATALLEVSGPAGKSDGGLGPWFLKFLVPGRSGMGIHSGRAGVPDALGRTGTAHCTLGCIRTTDEAMAKIAQTWEADDMAELEVVA